MYDSTRFLHCLSLTTVISMKLLHVFDAAFYCFMFYFENLKSVNLLRKLLEKVRYSESTLNGIVQGSGCYRWSPLTAFHICLGKV